MALRVAVRLPTGVAEVSEVSGRTTGLGGSKAMWARRRGVELSITKSSPFALE